MSRTAQNRAYLAGQDMTSSFNAPTVFIKHLNGYSVVVTATWTSGTLAGTFKLQASNDALTDDNAEAANPTATWVDVAGSPFSVSITSGSVSNMWNVSQPFYEYFRLVWTSSSGVGTANANFFAKQNGSN